ncbi:MAG: Fe-S cluster assembly protein SufD [Gorillibacterium sp.]|nr:Fe-S cluster assembly protein SufD [Gorillibacterium sp.]
MTLNTTLPIDHEAITERSCRLGEPGWLTEQRVKGLQLASEIALPKLTKMRIDRWKLDAYGEYTEDSQTESIEALLDASGFPIGENGVDNILVQQNSSVIYTSLTTELAEKGVIYTDLATAAKEHGDLVQKYFFKTMSANENQLLALHSALWNGGVFLYVPKNVTVQIPLRAIFLSDRKGAALAPHVLVIAEEGSSVSYVENFISAGTSSELVVNAAVEVFVGQGAKVRFASIHSFEEAVTDISYRRAVLERDAKIEWVIGEMNSGNGVSDTTNYLNGSGSSADVKVICVGDKEQKLNLTTRNIHVGKATKSDMSTRAVILESATAIINGITKIEKGATGANGQQTEKVLMLSRTARGDANPILLIDEDDVIAGHAASVGQVNPDQIYYLMSRGLPKAEAERLVIYGFLAPVVAKLPLPELENQFRQLVERKLGQ